MNHIGETVTPQRDLPEQLISSRQVGHVPGEKFPWLDDVSALSVSELVFPEGAVYAASAGNNKFDKITATVRAADKQTDEHGYNRLDGFFLRACHLEVSGGAIGTDRIQTVRHVGPDFDGVLVKDYREAPTPNARRVYYALTRLHEAGFQAQAHVDPNSLLLLRLGATDKHHQVEFLGRLTGLSRKTLKARGAGS